MSKKKNRTSLVPDCVITRISKECNISNEIAKEVVESLVNVIKENVSTEGQSLNIRGLGTFTGILVEEKNWYNPFTRETQIIPKHITPFFKFSFSLKTKLKKSSQESELVTE